MPVRDRGRFIEYENKEIRLTGTSGILARSPAVMETFVDDLSTGRWTATETGTGTSHAPFTVAATANDGGYSVGVAGGTSANAQELGGKHIIWKPSTIGTDRQLVFETRAKFVGATTASDGDFCIGLADAATYASGLAYVISAASALTTTAPTEFVGFFYSSLATSGQMFNSGGNNFLGTITTKNNVDTLTASTLVKDSNFHIYRIQVNTAGNTAFFVDDNLVLSVGAAMTAATALTPYIAVIGENSHANTATVDYVYVAGDTV